MKTKYWFIVMLSWAWSAAVLPAASGQTWTPTTNWLYGESFMVTGSADGSKLLATAREIGSWLNVSTDAGMTWQALTNGAGGHSVASSADGNKLVAMGTAGIYTSTNAGASWVTISAPSRPCSWVASSADGNKLVAVTWPGAIYTSADAGATWTSNNAPNEYWNSVASSADGNKLAAVSGGATVSGVVYTSTNAGGFWVSNNVPSRGWVCVASSANGNKVAAVGNLTGTSVRMIYTSTNAGAFWVSNNLPGLKWSSIASSADGNKLVVGGYPAIYTSTNSGATWESNNVASIRVTGLASSADGNSLVAMAGRAVYVSRSTPAPQLTLTPLGTNAVLSWLIPSLPFTLQQNSDLTTANWTAVTNPPVLNLTNLHNEITLPLLSADTFYRLKSSP